MSGSGIKDKTRSVCKLSFTLQRNDEVFSGEYTGEEESECFQAMSCMSVLPVECPIRPQHSDRDIKELHGHTCSVESELNVLNAAVSNESA